MQCPVCSQDHFLPAHIRQHGLTESQFKEKFPGVPLVPQAEQQAIFEGVPPLYQRPVVKELTHIRVGNYDMPFYREVPREACLPCPANYRLPQHGDLADAVDDVLLAYQQGVSVYIYGPPGSGKDGLVHYLAATTRRPSLIFQIQPGMNVRNWFFMQQFNTQGTYYEEGVLLKALRDGYVTASGARIPYLILITDFDRADRSQAELPRLVMDSIEGRIMGPDGQVHRVLKGTTIVATANSAGAGDESGRLVSTNPIDSSILDRFQQMSYFPWIDWEDEREIAYQKFPWLKEYDQTLVPLLGSMVYNVREAIKCGNLPCEYTHRSLCNTLQAWRAQMDAGRQPRDALRRALRSTFVHRMPNEMARQDATRMMAPFVKD